MLKLLFIISLLLIVCGGNEESEHSLITFRTKKILKDVVSMSSLTGTNDLGTQVCKGSEYVEGEWIYREDIVDKDFVCCTWDALDYKFNTDVCGENYLWSPIYLGSDYHYTLTGGHGCYCDKREEKYRYSPQKREKYIWQPKKCRLLPWNGKQFCALLGSRRIMLLGDSTMKQSMATFASMIFEHGGGCAHQLFFVENNKLVTNPSPRVEDVVVSKYPFTALLPIIESHMPDIIISTIGAHIRNFAEYDRVEKEFLTSFMPQFYHSKHVNPQMKFVFRGQHPGHINCASFQDPIQTLKEYNIQQREDTYNWNTIKQYDDRMQLLVQKIREKYETALAPDYNQSRIVYLDTTPLYLRPDAHSDVTDCLHYCLPGPLNLEANILLTKLFTGEL